MDTALRYRVGGMDCASCAGSIETALNRIRGAHAVHVNLQTETLVLELDERTTPRERIEAQVRDLGFEISPTEVVTVVTEQREPAWWSSAELRLLLGIGALLLGGLAVCAVIPDTAGWVALPAALFGLWVFGRRAIALARAGSPFSIQMLMSVATVGAILIGAPTEAAVVVLLFTLGEMLEGVAAGRARAGIRALSALTPRTAAADRARGAARSAGGIAANRPGPAAAARRSGADRWLRDRGRIRNSTKARSPENQVPWCRGARAR